MREVLRFVDVFLPNEREACKIAGTEDLEAAIENLAGWVPLLVVKLGRKGAMAVQEGKRVVSPALQVAAVDTVGAGDAFNAGLAVGISEGKDLTEAIALGVALWRFAQLPETTQQPVVRLDLDLGPEVSLGSGIGPAVSAVSGCHSSSGTSRSRISSALDSGRPSAVSSSP